MPHPEPKPPSAEEAARIVNESWKDPDFGTIVWLAMRTGIRRGELCALRWSAIDLAKGVLTIRTSMAQADTSVWEKDTKTHQARRIAIDADTVTILSEHLDRCADEAATVGVAITADAFVFSSTPGGTKPLRPDTLTQRYSKMASRLGIKTHLHALRHYSATELIAGGVDIRTVAGRLGHGGGGATTLRVYAAWRSESDQRAARTLGERMPQRPPRTPRDADGPTV